MRRQVVATRSTLRRGQRPVAAGLACTRSRLARIDSMSKPTIADVMREYANGAVAYAKRVHGVDLNYSEKSLDDVDAIIATRIASGLIVPDELPASEREELWTFCKVLGGYVGEVILRNLGGAWEMQDAGDGSGTVSLVIGG